MNQKLELNLHNNDLSVDQYGTVSRTQTSLGSYLHKLKLMWSMSEAEVVEKLASDAVKNAEQRYFATGSFSETIKSARSN